MKSSNDKAFHLKASRSLLLATGFVVAISLSLVAFEWKSFYEIPNGAVSIPIDDPIEVIDQIEITYRKPDAPKLKPKANKPPIPVVELIVEKIDKPIIEEPTIESNEITEEFKIEEGLPMHSIEEEEDTGEPFVVVGEMPQFPGGDVGLLKYLGEALTYPSICKENGITGTVWIYYVVNEIGEIENVRVRKSADPFLDREAVRVVSSIKGYSPGKQRGKPVKVEFTVPIRFELKDSY